MKFFSLGGRARGAAPPCKPQHPLVKILVTVYISKTIRARKSKILQAHTIRRAKYSFWNVKTFRKGATQKRRAP